jgi:hypothetical protein
MLARKKRLSSVDCSAVGPFSELVATHTLYRQDDTDEEEYQCGQTGGALIHVEQ